MIAISNQGKQITGLQLIRIFQELKSKTSIEGKENAGKELKDAYSRNLSKSEEIFSALQDLINSTDPNQKISGLIALYYLSEVIQENQYMTFVNKFISVVFLQFSQNNDEKIQRKTSLLYGSLLRLGGTKITQVMEQHVNETIRWLKLENQNPIKTFATILALHELLIEAPYITFNILFNCDEYFMLISNLIRNKNELLRKEALNFFALCIKIISQREIEIQKDFFQKFYSEIHRTRTNIDDDVIHGNILAIKILLPHSQQDFFKKDIILMSEYVFKKKESKNQIIQEAVLETIPIIAKYGINEQKFQDECISHLKTLSKTTNNQKQKALCYSTLSEIYNHLSEDQIKQKVKDVVKNLLEDLELNKKQFCIEMVVCLESILEKLGKGITEYADIQVLIDSILLNGLYTQSVKLLTKISKLGLQDISEYIQCKLLLSISVILIKKHYLFQHPEQLNQGIIQKFQQNLSEALLNTEFRTNERIAMSIQTLSTFKFDAYNEELTRFVKDCVLSYLDDTNPIIRNAAAQAGCLIYTKNDKQSKIKKNRLHEIIEKFMSLALSDPEKEIRQTMLQSLNENFDIYLNSSKYLRKLFLCVNDTNNKIQELSLMILCRLSVYNPTDVIPFLKKTLFYYLNSLSFDENLLTEGEIIDQFNLLTCLIKHGNKIVKPHTEIIASVLLKCLKDQNLSVHLFPALIRCFSQLSSLGDPQIILYLDEIINIILQAMQDKSYTVKRESAVKALVEILKNNGYAVLPYYKFPQLLEIILSLMKNETSQEMRINCLRLIGCLGAIDNFYYKRVLQKFNKFLSLKQVSQIEKINELNHIINVTLKKKFRSMQRFNEDLKNIRKNNLAKELHSYYEDLILFGNLKQQKNMLLYLANFEKQQVVVKTTIIKNALNQYQKEEHGEDNIEEILASSTEIQLNNDDYYSTVTIKTLLKILMDQSLNAQHKLAIDTLMKIVGNLKSRTSNFLYLLIPVFKKIINVQELKEKLLVMIEKIICLCQIYFDVQYIDPIIDIFLQQESDFKHTSICFDIMITLISCRKNSLRNKIEPIIRVINQIISKNEENKEFIKKGLTIYYILGDVLEGHLPMIINFCCKLLVKEHDIIDFEIRREIVILFVSLAKNCSQTIQNLSIMVDSLLIVLRNYESNNPYLTTIIMGCFVIFIKQYKNQFLVYLPFINNEVNRFKINHGNYKECIEFLLNYGDLDEIRHFLGEKEDMVDFSKYYQPIYVQEPKEINSLKKINVDSIFDTKQKTLKEDWVEWMRKSSLEIIKQNPNIVISSCHQIAEVYPQLSTELYNIAFTCFWGVLNNKQKELITSQILRAVNSQQYENIPINILQTILNLAEFMSHGKECLQIDNCTIGNLAERCLASAKALYYREKEFQNASETTIEHLITLYTNLGQKDAAEGLLTYAKDILNIELKLSWFENLQRWDKALEEYRIKSTNNPSNEDEYLLPKMRCLNAMSDFQVVIQQCDKLLKSPQEETKEKAKSMIHLASNAAMNLGYWDKLQEYVQYLDDSQDKNFWQAAISINYNNFEQARIFINKAINKSDSQVSALLRESHIRAYESLLRLQQLFEMEEIVDLKEFEQTIESIGKESKGELKVETINEYQRRKQNLQDIWNDRLIGNPTDLDTWQKVLSVRGLLLSKAENMEKWLKFSKVALKSKQIQLSNTTLDKLKLEINPKAQNEFQYPPKLVLASFEQECYTGKIKEKEIVEKINLILLDEFINIDNKLKAKFFLKIGKFLSESNEEKILNIDQITSLYKQSLHFNEDYYKTWHQYALLNFTYAKQFSQSEEGKQSLKTYLLFAFKGFIKSISLGYSKDQKSKFLLQDSLRLLTIIFQYGTITEIAQEFSENFKSIDIRVWIDVIPQIIARISIPEKIIQNMLKDLLIHISGAHPQALIYPLTVACNTNQDNNNLVPQTILKQIMSRSILLVQQAEQISTELNRVAILLKEHWYDGIAKAFESFFSDNKLQIIKILQNLHQVMKQHPQSQSEIAFHQKFKADLNEAEAWLIRFIQTGDDICYYQSLAIHYQILEAISPKLNNLKMVHLENVSPILLSTKNCVISVPGMYKPNKPVISISCFQPKLPVLASKQRPRKIYIYGNDNKEYLFLLKGREDLRSDERSMQLFGLVNRLLQNNPVTKKKDLQITRFSIIRLSTNTGLIGWVPDCDTLTYLIKEYRDTCKIPQQIEISLRDQFTSERQDKPVYDNLPLPNKVEIFRYVLENTKGEDLQNILWLKSPNSEVWLERRTNYIRSLATMSIIGYILGLGDRHLSNIMLQRKTGKIVHIDFGDCFEVTMIREKFPERVPFRLTRMLVKAMEACGIEGSYRNTCELVMAVVRQNKDSLLAVLEAFIYDPLVNWNLVTKEKTDNLPNKQDQLIIKEAQVYIGTLEARQISKENFIQTQLFNDDKEMNEPKEEIFNKRAIEVMERIKKKLHARDFKENETLNVKQQVRYLINQATSHENLCQAFIGWNPFW